MIVVLKGVDLVIFLWSKIYVHTEIKMEKMLMHQYTTDWWGICFISLLFDQT